MDGHLPLTHLPFTQGWSPIRRMSTTDSDFITLTELAKLIPRDNCHGWSPTIPRMVNNQPNDGHPPEQQEPRLNFLGRSSTRG